MHGPMNGINNCSPVFHDYFGADSKILTSRCQILWRKLYRRDCHQGQEYFGSELIHFFARMIKVLSSEANILDLSSFTNFIKHHL